MCLIVFAWGLDPEFPLVFAGNRDEFFARPTEVAHWWDDAPGLLAGRDLEGGGTWCGVTEGGRLAALTNFRAPSEKNPAAPSRGQLVSGYLSGAASAREFLAAGTGSKEAYNGYNLVLGEDLGSERARLWVDSNREQGMPRLLAPGLYGVSNAHFDTPWPKVKRAKEALGAVLRRTLVPQRAGIAGAPLGRSEAVADSGADSGADASADSGSDSSARAAQLQSMLLAVLAEADPWPDALLPATGVPLATERSLSSAFIRMAGYGTRASTIILVDRWGRIRFLERTFEEAGPDHAVPDVPFSDHAFGPFASLATGSSGP